MRVKVTNRLYQMSKLKYKKLLEVASEQVTCGVYAVEKGDYAELRNDKCDSMTQLKRMLRDYKAAGFKPLYNRG